MIEPYTPHYLMLINEFENKAFIFNEINKISVYLFRFYSQTQPVTYAHLTAIRNSYRKLTLAENFMNIY